MKEVVMYTDGACSGNPGPGGWAAKLIYGSHSKIISGGYRLTTNNRMELMAIIEGLKALNSSCKVSIYSDSKLITDAFNQGWLDNWQKNNWKKGPKLKDPVKNSDLWLNLSSLARIHELRFTWVKAHAGNPDNEEVDAAAVEAAKSGELVIDEVYEASQV